MPTVLNIAAYRFVLIEEPAAVVARVRVLCEVNALKGTVLVAPEGINIFLAGIPTAIHAFLDALSEDVRFAELAVKFSHSDRIPFKRLRVKLKREIITFRTHSPSPAIQRAPAVAPQLLREWLKRGRDDAGRELVLLDTRNRQEVEYGSFKNALSLAIDKFTDLPLALENHRESLRDKTIVSFCTGGIRCEKAALWMQQAGYENVLQLDGGILGYFEQGGGDGYLGRCFVFDERIALDTQLQS